MKNPKKFPFFGLLILLLIAASLSVPIRASSLGTLQGIVTDSTGAVVPDATIMVVHWTADSRNHLNPSVEPMVRTDSQGRFSIQLPAGLCDIFISYSMFSPFAKKVKIDADKVTTLKPKLAFDRLVHGIE